MAGEEGSIVLPQHKLEISESIINGIDGIVCSIPNFHHTRVLMGENMNNDPFGADGIPSPFDFCFNNIAFLKFHIISFHSSPNNRRTARVSGTDTNWPQLKPFQAFGNGHELAEASKQSRHQRKR